MKKGNWSPCSANNMTLCCKQVISSSTFKSQQTNKSYTIFHEVNCSSAYVIYLMKCSLCKKQYVGKSETNFNIRLNAIIMTLKNPMQYQRGDTTFSTNTQSSSIQINLHIPPPNQKTFDSNTGSATHKIIESRAKYLIKMTVALLPNVQFQQFHRSHVTHEVKFRHSLSKTIIR